MRRGARERRLRVFALAILLAAFAAPHRSAADAEFRAEMFFRDPSIASVVINPPGTLLAAVLYDQDFYEAIVRRVTDDDSIEILKIRSPILDIDWAGDDASS
ncbi:MAG TPA: hypothetical protein VIY27_10350 [Myxococcota bacterium]